MKILLTGATGFIGNRLALSLAGKGHQVHALYRDSNKTDKLNHPNITLFKGDILDLVSLKKAAEGCALAYHCAAFARVFEKETFRIYRQNIEGALNVIQACKEAGVSRVLCVSTAGVFGPSGPNMAIVEEQLHPEYFFTDYEASKSIMESVIKSDASIRSRVIMVNPSRVYGPGNLSDSNGVTRMILKYIQGKWWIVPGDGKSMGNYVFIDDVVEGCQLAMEHGIPGENYILGGTNLSYDSFFDILAEVSGYRRRMVHLPVSLIVAVAQLLLFLSRITGKGPLITPALSRKYNHHWNLSSEKAQLKLGYKITDFRSGASVTIEWLKSNMRK